MVMHDQTKFNRYKKEKMKNTKPNPGGANVQFNTKKHRPENKDNLDSREGEEQQFKGDDMTNNKKETKSTRKTSRKQ